MSNGYLGEELVKQEDTEEFKDYTPSDWAMYFISCYGQIDGAHHKAWVLDQVARILKGTQVEIKRASWSDGYSEYRISTVDESSDEYNKWVIEMKGELQSDEDEEPEYEYDYDEGIAP